MWPVINSSVLIGWNIHSSLNALMSTNEMTWIYNRSHGLWSSLWLNLTDKRDQYLNTMILSKWKHGTGSLNWIRQWQFLLNLVGFWLPFSLNQQFVIVFVHKMSNIKVKLIYHE